MEKTRYAAKVVSTEDSENRGRIRVSCPEVYGDSESPYVLPNFPVASPHSGIFIMPRVNDLVWISFRENDVNQPIWTGGVYSQEESPLASESPVEIDKEDYMIRTPEGKTVIMTKDKLELSDELGNVIRLDSRGITIESSEEIVIKGDKIKLN